MEEACYVYGTLGCDEQMWDYEGKAADVDVILKLLLKEPEYFLGHMLGEEICRASEILDSSEGLDN